MATYNTDAAPEGSFQPHGNIKVRVHQNIAEYLVRGPLDIETLKALNAVEPEVISAVSAELGAWAAVVEFEKSCIALDEFLKGLEKYLRLAVDAKMNTNSAAFVLTKNLEGYSMMKGRYMKPYEAAGIPVKIFDNKADAIAWSKTLLDPQ